MAIHSSSLAWKIPWTEEPSGLQYIGSPRVRHDGASNTYFFYILFHYGLSKDTEYSFLCYTAAPCCLFILYIILCAMPFKKHYVCIFHTILFLILFFILR